LIIYYSKLQALLTKACSIGVHSSGTRKQARRKHRRTSLKTRG